MWVILYITLPLALLPFWSKIDGNYQWQTILGTFILIWINDTGAYCIGILFGKHRLWEKVSPKKSWEGAIGGFVFTALGAYIISIFWNDISLQKWLIAAVIISPMAIIGDLVESNMKRSLNIKDSGSIIPGHGGILDRFDAAFWVLPVVFIYLQM
jgi:phosphatidate cytidylyltransferase